MATSRRRHSPELKARIAVEAIKGHKSTGELALEYGVHPTQVSQWKKQALNGLPELFSGQTGMQRQRQDELIAYLYQQIGKLKMELERKK